MSLTFEKFSSRLHGSHCRCWQHSNVCSYVQYCLDADLEQLLQSEAPLKYVSRYLFCLPCHVHNGHSNILH